MRLKTMALRLGAATAILAATLPTGAGAEAFAAESGVVTGTVMLDGPPPTRPPLEVFKYREICGGTVVDERLLVGRRGGVRYVVVTVEGVKNGKAVERDTTQVLDNNECRFVPHVQVAEVGQWLEIVNTDPILHNADARIGNESLFNVALPPARRVRKPLARAGTMMITCNVRHSWMSAIIAVADHPYHTVTDAEGSYEIRDLPPGTYTLRLWHEELGTREQPVTITAGETAVVDVTYPALGSPKPAAASKKEAAR
jgi:hypothetical protein